MVILLKTMIQITDDINFIKKITIRRAKGVFKSLFKGGPIKTQKEGHR